MRFHNRTEAGQMLAKPLEQYRGEVVVFALPRGGVVLGAEVARHLQAPLDLLIPRKIGHPSNPEYAVCALAESGHLACSPQALASLDAEWLEEAVKRERVEAARRRALYLAGRPPISAAGKTAIIIDDGAATGLTMIAAILDAKERRPAKIVVAAPVLSTDIAQLLHKYADEVTALNIPDFYLGAVGAYYEQFDQVDDDTVVEILNAESRQERDESRRQPPVL